METPNPEQKTQDNTYEAIQRKLKKSTQENTTEITKEKVGLRPAHRPIRLVSLNDSRPA